MLNEQVVFVSYNTQKKKQLQPNLYFYVKFQTHIFGKAQCAGWLIFTHQTIEGKKLLVRQADRNHLYPNRGIPDASRTLHLNAPQGVL